MEAPQAPQQAEAQPQPQARQEGSGEEQHRALVQAKWQDNLNKGAQQFELVWTGVLIGYFTYYVLSTQFVDLNYFPTATGSVSIVLHLLAIAARHCCGRLSCCGRVGRLTRHQAWHTLAICIDTTLICLANPEFQYFAYSTGAGPLLTRWFGKKPRCSLEHFAAHGRCMIPYAALQNAIISFTACVFYVIFVLDFRHSVVALLCNFLAFQAIRMWARVPLLVRLDGFAVMDVCYIVPIYLVLVAAKWKIHVFQQQLMVELVRKQKEVVEEKVNRCQVEFQIETMGAVQEPQASQHTPSGIGSAVTSSGAAFLPTASEDEEALEEKLREIAKLGRREHWLIDPGDVTLQPGRVLGRGCFGVVLTGSFVGSPVAVKVALNWGTGSGLLQLANELRTFRHVRHPNIALFHGACFAPAENAAEKDTLALVLELVEGTDLEAYMRPKGEAHLLVSDSARCKILLDVCRALNYLHTRRPCIIHGDVKPLNMIVEQLGRRASPRVKLLDFGLARVLTAHARPMGGTLAWMAPEVFQRSALQTSGADVYSFGRVAFFMVTGLEPYAEVTRRMLEGYLRSAEPPPLRWPPTRLAARCQALAGHCMGAQASTRPSLGEVHEDLVRWPQDLGVPDLGSSGPEEGAHRSWSAALDELLQMMETDPAARGRPRAEPRATLSRGGGGGGAIAAGAQAAAPNVLPTLSGDSEDNAGALACFSLTPPATKHAIICNALLQWCRDAPEGGCCSFHGALEDALGLCQELLSSSCKPRLVEESQETYTQCPNCLAIIGRSEDGRGPLVCAVCNQYVPGTAPLAEEGAMQRRLVPL